MRLFFNFFFSLAFFEKASLTFSHFEFYYKYAFLAARVFYYDGALMEGLFAFETDFNNAFLRRSFFFKKKRNRRLLGSRNGRFFLFIFYSFFRFSNFFKTKYLNKQKIRKQGSLKLRSFVGRLGRVLRLVPVRRRLTLKRRALAKAQAKAKAKAAGKVYVHFRRSRKRVFFSYRRLFLGRPKKFKFSRSRSRGSRPRNYRSERGPLGRGTQPSVRRVPVQPKPGARTGRPVPKQHGVFSVQGGGLKALKLRKDSPKGRFSHFFHKKMRFFKPRKGRPVPKVAALNRQQLLERKRRGAVFRLFKSILRHCRVSRLGAYVKKLRAYFSSKFLLRAELKIFVIFLILFRRIWFLFQSLGIRLSQFDFFKEIFFTASFLFFHGSFSAKVISRAVLSFLRILGLNYLPLRVGLFLLSNDTVTASFLSKFIGRKLVQGFRYREILNPIMHDLYKTSRSIRAPRYTLASQLTNRGAFFSSSYKNGVIRSFILKFFYIYKRFYGKFFWLHCSWINFYFYKVLVFFFKKASSGLPFLLGFSKKFMVLKQGFLFFFNYDNAFFRNSLSFVFNELFFDFLNRAWGQSLFFYFIFDDLFAHSSVLFFGQPWKKLYSHKLYPVALFFFNRLVRYSYWRYRRSWLIEFNGLNKLRLRFMQRPGGHGLLGFKVHLRGRFSRKQKASSL